VNNNPGVLRHTLVLISGVLACPWAALADDEVIDAEAATTLPAITVTADKTVRALEAVPVSMSVLDRLDVERAQITGVEQLEARAPGLAFQPYGQRGIKMPVMRGLSANIWSFSSSVLMLVDDVPVLMPQGFEASFLDVGRVEVLRGPQSTLYGRNAEAGVIAIHSRPLDDTPRASVSGEVGSRNKHALRVALASPLVEGALYGSLSGSWMEQDGFIRNTYKGKRDDDYDHKYLNVGLRWTPTDAADLVLRYTRQDYNDGASPWGNNDGSPRVKVASDTPSGADSLGQTLSLNAGFALPGDLRLRAISTWSKYQEEMIQDSDFTAAPIRYIQRDNTFKTWSQELRLEGNLGSADWLLGAYGERGDHDLSNFSGFMGTRSGTAANWRTRSAAVFTHWNIPLSQTWSLAAGARVERNTADIRPTDAPQRQRNWTDVSPKLALQYQFHPEHQWYLSASRGIRAGGYNIFGTGQGKYTPYAPEKAWSYETGVKGFALNERLRYGLAVYYMDIKDMQVMQQPARGVTFISSAASATSKGLEVDADYLLGQTLGGHWRVQGGISWQHTRFDRFIDGPNDYSGQHNPYVPAINGHLGLRFEADPGIYAQMSVRASSKMYLDPGNQYQRTGYGLLDLTLGWQHRHWDISAYAHNLTDKEYDAPGYQGGFVTIYSPPREYGLRVTWRM